MNIMKELEELAYLLPSEQSNISELSEPLQKAIRGSDGNLIKNILSDNKLNADMTKVTTFE